MSQTPKYTVKVALAGTLDPDDMGMPDRSKLSQEQAARFAAIFKAFEDVLKAEGLDTKQVKSVLLKTKATFDGGTFNYHDLVEEFSPGQEVSQKDIKELKPKINLLADAVEKSPQLAGKMGVAKRLKDSTKRLIQKATKSMTTLEAPPEIPSSMPDEARREEDQAGAEKAAPAETTAPEATPAVEAPKPRKPKIPKQFQMTDEEKDTHAKAVQDVKDLNVKVDIPGLTDEEEQWVMEPLKKRATLGQLDAVIGNVLQRLKEKFKGHLDKVQDNYHGTPYIKRLDDKFLRDLDSIKDAVIEATNFDRKMKVDLYSAVMVHQGKELSQAFKSYGDGVKKLLQEASQGTAYKIFRQIKEKYRTIIDQIKEECSHLDEKELNGRSPAEFANNAVSELKLRPFNKTLKDMMDEYRQKVEEQFKTGDFNKVRVNELDKIIDDWVQSYHHMITQVIPHYTTGTDTQTHDKPNSKDLKTDMTSNPGRKRLKDEATDERMKEIKNRRDGEGESLPGNDKDEEVGVDDAHFLRGESEPDAVKKNPQKQETELNYIRNRVREFFDDVQVETKKLVNHYHRGDFELVTGVLKNVKPEIDEDGSSYASFVGNLKFVNKLRFLKVANFEISFKGYLTYDEGKFGGEIMNFQVSPATFEEFVPKDRVKLKNDISTLTIANSLVQGVIQRIFMAIKQSNKNFREDNPSMMQQLPGKVKSLFKRSSLPGGYVITVTVVE